MIPKAKDRAEDVFMQDFYNVLMETAENMEISHKDKHHLARKVIEEMQYKWAGTLIYICKDRWRKTKERHEKIIAESINKSPLELAMKYRLSVQAIYKILRINKQQRNQHVG